MSRFMKNLFLTAFACLVMIAPVSAEIVVKDAYARVATPMARVGAAYMTFENTGTHEMRLIAVESDAAMRVELHTHTETDGVMQMREIEEGIAVPALGIHMLKRGGDHVMFMGLANRWAEGDLIPVTLIFENDMTLEIEVQVDLDRKPIETMNHGN